MSRHSDVKKLRELSGSSVRASPSVQGAHVDAAKGSVVEIGPAPDSASPREASGARAIMQNSKAIPA
jgi:hypothetical protein